MRHILLLIAFLLLASCCTDVAVAATYNWANAAGGSFSTAANWSPSGTPNSGDTANFGITNTYVVTFSGSPVVTAVTQSQGDVTLDLNGGTLQASSSANNVLGTAALTSTMRVIDGNFRPNNLSIGNVVGSTSNLFLGIDSASRTNFGPFLVGTLGTGNLWVQSGATLLNNAGSGLGINTGAVGIATVSGTASAWTINNFPLLVGSDGTGTLNILSGGAVTAFGLEVGENLGSTGTVSVSGNLATFTTGGTANIGGNLATEPAASATLNIGRGATMSLNGTTNLRTYARVNVNGGTLNLNTLNFSSGASVRWTEGTVNFATAPSITTSVIDLLLDGSHVLGQNRTLSATAGIFTLATPLDLAGGRIAVPSLVINTNMDLGAFSTIAATNTVTLQPGATVQLRNFATLGATTAVINNGGTLLLDGALANVTGLTTNTAGYITGTGRFTAGLNNAAGGTIRAESEDHLIIDTVGRTNLGTIELAGGTVEYSQALINQAGGTISGRGVFRGSSAAPGGNGLTNNGVASFSAGITDLYGDVNNAVGGKIVAAGASTVTFFDDVVNNGDIRTVTGSRTVFFGSVSGAGTFTGGGVVELEGDLKPGNSPANITFGGNVEIAAAAGLEIELAGTTKGAQYDSLTIAGTASLSGTLNASLLDGFIPSSGQVFEILTAGGINGTFDTTNLPALAGGLFFDLDYTPHAIMLSVAGIPGDFNLSGTVDSADYVVWRKSLGQFGAALAADANNSGNIDQDDYGIWRSNFGATASFGSGASLVNTAVPEPATWISAACLLALTLLSNRRR